MKHDVRPPLIPQTPSPPPPKRAKSRAVLVLSILLLLLSVVFFGTVVLIIGSPQVVGLTRQVEFSRTQQAQGALFRETQIALDSTTQAQESRESAYYTQLLNLQSTALALSEREFALDSTQYAIDAQRQATQTAVSQFNAQQGTQSAQNLVATQTALSQIATQAQVNFSATQSALNQAIWTPEPTAFPNVALIDAGTVNVSEMSAWTGVAPNNAWAQMGGGALVAQVENATLITSQSDFGAQYRVTYDLTPIRTASRYDLFFGMMDNGTGYTVRVFFDGEQVSSVALVRVVTQTFLSAQQLGAEEVVSRLDNLNLGNQIALVVNLDESNMTATLNGLAVFNETLDRAPLLGAVGVQAPIGTQLRTLNVSR